MRAPGLPLLATLVLCLLPTCAQAADERLGRLFHSPAQRIEIEAQKNRAHHTPSQTDQEELSLQGIVRRSGGHSTVWLNGKAYQDQAPVSGIENNAVRISTRDGRSRTLKVGQKLVVPSAGVEAAP